MWLRQSRRGARAGRLTLALLGALSILLGFTPLPAFASTTTFTFTCTMVNSAPTATITMGITGGTGTSVSPSTENCDGSGHTVTVTYTALTGATATATVAADSSTVHYRFTGGSYGSSSGTVNTGGACGSSTCPALTTPALYEGLNNTYAMDPVSPATWDASYSEPFYGYQLGALGTIATVSLTSGAGTANHAAFADYNTNLCFQDAWASTATPTKSWGIGQTGGAIAQCTKKTTGGNTLTELYILQPNITPTIPNVNVGQDWYQGLTDTAGGVLGLGRDWYQGLNEILTGLSAGAAHYSGPNPVIFLVCGNHTANTPLCSIQPVQFSPSGAIAVQVVTFSGCGPSPPTVLGDGGTYNVEVQGSCTLTASLPPGYIWTSTGSANAQTTTCAGGTCTAWILTYSAAQPTTVTLTVDNANQPLGGTATLTAITPFSPTTPYSILIFDTDNSTTVALKTCSSTPCILGVTSNHNSLQSFQAAVTSTGHISGALAVSSTVRVLWGTGGGNALCLSWKLVGGGTFNAPTVSYVSNGKALVSTLAATAQCYVTDAGSTWTVGPNPLTGYSASSGERAFTLNVTTGVSDPTYVEVFWHQYGPFVSYTLSDGGADTNHPTFAYYNFSSPHTWTMGRTPTQFWLDAGRPWTASNPFTTTPDLKLWFASPAGGVPTSGNNIVVAYGPQNACTGPWAAQLKAGCFWAAMGPYITIFGLQGFMGLVMLGVDGAVWIQTKNGWIVVIVMSAAAVLFGGALPQLFFLFALVLTGLTVAGVLLRIFWKRT